MGHHNEDSIKLTFHAKKRMSARGIDADTISLVLEYGRIAYLRNAVIYAIGRKEIKEHGQILSDCDGVHVLCSRTDGSIITTYRNHDLRGLRH